MNRVQKLEIEKPARIEEVFFHLHVISRWQCFILMFFTLAFFTGELIFADKFQSKDAMTSG